jgi:CRP/FNR family nitrogen fixation transcriptional regulator
MLASAQYGYANGIRSQVAFPPALVPPTVPQGLQDNLLAPIATLATTLHADRDEEIISQGDAAEYCYEVVTGCVRTVRLLEDGRRQLGEFLLAGDVFGWDTSDEYEFGAEAVTAVTLRRVRLSAVEDRASRDLNFAQRLRAFSTAQVRLARGRLVLLGRKTAAERVASFLLEMADRLHVTGVPMIELPMNRGDIADYLGLTIETVCRELTDLRHQGTIAVERARISILDSRALARAGSDRVH